MLTENIYLISTIFFKRNELPKILVDCSNIHELRIN